MFIDELKVATDNQMLLLLETGSLWCKPSWQAGADFTPHFLPIDSENACASTNRSSSFHPWSTVGAGSLREPLKQGAELNNGSSNYRGIQLRVHRGSKGVLQEPGGLRHVGNTTLQRSHRPSAWWAEESAMIAHRWCQNESFCSDLILPPSVCSATSWPYDPCQTSE